MGYGLSILFHKKADLCTPNTTTVVMLKDDLVVYSSNAKVLRHPGNPNPRRASRVEEPVLMWMS